MAFVYTWLRLSNARLLDWARRFSYQPKDIAWAQQQVRGARAPPREAIGAGAWSRGFAAPRLCRGRNNACCVAPWGPRLGAWRLP
jgi:hypothetical protein